MPRFPSNRGSSQSLRRRIMALQVATLGSCQPQCHYPPQTEEAIQWQLWNSNKSSAIHSVAALSLPQCHRAPQPEGAPPVDPFDSIPQTEGASSRSGSAPGLASSSRGSSTVGPSDSGNSGTSPLPQYSQDRGSLLPIWFF